ncbi:hypothetical protein BH11PAT2_BH11PAT2_09590 [soil metagenome]
MITHTPTISQGTATSNVEAINHKRYLSDSRRAGEDLDGVPLSHYGRRLYVHLATIDDDDLALMS